MKILQLLLQLPLEPGNNALASVPDPRRLLRIRNTFISSGCHSAIETKFFFCVFCFFPPVGTFTSFFKDTKLLRSHETVQIKFFFKFFGEAL
jgi:hypothetical protein